MIYPTDRKTHLRVEITRVEWQKPKACISVDFVGVEFHRSKVFPEFGFGKTNLWVWAPTNDIH